MPNIQTSNKNCTKSKRHIVGGVNWFAPSHFPAAVSPENSDFFPPSAALTKGIQLLLLRINTAVFPVYKYKTAYIINTRENVAVLLSTPHRSILPSKWKASNRGPRFRIVINWDVVVLFVYRNLNVQNLQDKSIKLHDFFKNKIILCIDWQW